METRVEMEERCYSLSLTLLFESWAVCIVDKAHLGRSEQFGLDECQVKLLCACHATAANREMLRTGRNPP